MLIKDSKQSSSPSRFSGFTSRGGNALQGPHDLPAAMTDPSRPGESAVLLNLILKAAEAPLPRSKYFRPHINGEPMPMRRARFNGRRGSASRNEYFRTFCSIPPEKAENDFAQKLADGAGGSRARRHARPKSWRSIVRISQQHKQSGSWLMIVEQTNVWSCAGPRLRGRPGLLVHRIG